MRILLAAILVSLVATAAAADPKPNRDVGRMVTDDCAKARKLNRDCILTMESHEVNGGTPGATGINVTVLKPTPQPSLIRIRRDFIQEIVKTAEDL